MIAALQMYDWPEVRADTDNFWRRVADSLYQRGIEAPDTLSRPENISEPWTDQDLMLGQTCGLPFVSGRCGDAIPVARPVFDLEGANGGNYSSALVCRIEDPARGLAGFRGRIAAINEYGSQSGCNALADAVLDTHNDMHSPFFHKVVISGAHRNSASMIAKGQADIAAIDSVAWALFGQAEPKNRARLRVLSWTRPMPALPFITAKRFANQRQVIFESLQSASKGHAVPTLPINVKPCSDADYDPIRRMAKRILGLKLSADATEL